jgi:hypothetical protein
VVASGVVAAGVVASGVVSAGVVFSAGLLQATIANIITMARTTAKMRETFWFFILKTSIINLELGSMATLYHNAPIFVWIFIKSSQIFFPKIPVFFLFGHFGAFCVVSVKKQ